LLNEAVVLPADLVRIPPAPAQFGNGLDLGLECADFLQLGGCQLGQPLDLLPQDRVLVVVLGVDCPQLLVLVVQLVDPPPEGSVFLLKLIFGLLVESHLLLGVQNSLLEAAYLHSKHLIFILQVLEGFHIKIVPSVFLGPLRYSVPAGPGLHEAADFLCELHMEHLVLFDLGLDEPLLALHELEHFALFDGRVLHHLDVGHVLLHDRSDLLQHELLSRQHRPVFVVH
jgi:hypothetical protein